MRRRTGSDIIAGMRSRLVRLALVTITVCTATACQTPNPEGASKDAVVKSTTPDTKTGDTKDTKAVEPVTPAPTTAVPGPPTAETAATAGTATAPGTVDLVFWGAAQTGKWVIITGDRHFAQVSHRDDVLPYPLVELMASGMNTVWYDGSQEPDRYRDGETLPDYNFGVLRIHGRKGSLRYALHNGAGEEWKRGEIRF